MSTTLTELTLAKILARAEAATPGPWCTDEWEIYQGAKYVPGVSAWVGETCRGIGSAEQDRSDATFVAAAREDVPALVAEVVRLRRMVACDQVRDMLAAAEQENRELRSRVAELEALKPARFQDCQVCGAGYEYGRACAACAFNERMAAERVALGQLAEQRHLMDPLDHTLELLPVRHPEALPEMQRMSGNPIPDAPAPQLPVCPVCQNVAAGCTCFGKNPGGAS